MEDYRRPLHIKLEVLLHSDYQLELHTYIDETILYLKLALSTMHKNFPSFIRHFLSKFSVSLILLKEIGLPKIQTKNTYYIFHSYKHLYTHYTQGAVYILATPYIPT